jgi:hypothetical protein
MKLVADRAEFASARSDYTEAVYDVSKQNCYCLLRQLTGTY